jgi:hypothetical protein
MRSSKQPLTPLIPDFFDVLSVVDPTTLIPILEKGVEWQELIAQNEDEAKDTTRDSRVLLAFLRGKKLGL